MNTKIKFILVKVSLILIAVVWNSTLSQAQQVVWRYEYETGENTIPGSYWIDEDEDGNGYFNIIKNTRENRRQYDHHYSMLILNADGEYNGSVYVKQCERGGSLLPFSEDRYIMSGQFCGSSKMSDRRSFLLDYTGKLISEHKAFTGNYFAITISDKGLTYFSKPTRRFSYTFLSIGYIDENFERAFDSIPLSSLKREGLGMAFNYISPVQI